MSIWADIGRFLASVATDAVSTVIEAVRTIFEGNAETRKRVGFSVALIALFAKMAKADGVVSEAEVEAFRDVFSVPEEEFDNVARLYNLAKQDVAGYHAYAAQVRALFPGDDPTDVDVLHDVLDALFHIAKADGLIHENELLFLEDIAVEFGFTPEAFERIKLRHLESEGCDPYVVLGADRSWDYERLKRQYYKRVMECHPDKLIARGVPREFVVIANDRLAAVNAAWEMVQSARQGERVAEVAGVS